MDIDQDFDSHEMRIHGPMTAGALRDALRGVPDNAPVAMYSDEEGNGLYALWCVDVGVKDKAVILRPAGDDLLS